MYNNSITKEVKNGKFEEVDEYKLLGVWINSKASYMININKNQKRIKFMINSIKAFANEKNMGKLAAGARIKMMETVIMLSILHGSEAFPSFTREEEDELEKMQGVIVRDILEVSPSTPYNALLLELRNANHESTNTLQKTDVVSQLHQLR